MILPRLLSPITQMSAVSGGRDQSWFLRLVWGWDVDRMRKGEGAGAEEGTVRGTGLGREGAGGGVEGPVRQEGEGEETE